LLQFQDKKVPGCLTPQQKTVIETERGETESKIEEVVSRDPGSLQIDIAGELQQLPQLQLRGDFQSPTMQTSTPGNSNAAGNGNVAGNGNGAGSGSGNNAGNGNRNGTQSGNGSRAKVPVVTRGETEAMRREKESRKPKDRSS
jgi:hypothetical protein